MLVSIRGTNGCLVGDTRIDCPRDLSRYPQGISIKDLVGKKFLTYSWCFEKDTFVLSQVNRVWCSGFKRVYRVALSGYPSGRGTVGSRLGGNIVPRYLPPCELVGTYDHLVLLSSGAWKKLGELEPGDSLKSLYRREADRGKLMWTSNVLVKLKIGKRICREYYGLTKGVNEQQFVCTAAHGSRPKGAEVHHRDHNRHNHTPMNLEWKEGFQHKSDHTRERNLAKSFGWQMYGNHPRGMQGKHHSEEAKLRISENSKKRGHKPTQPRSSRGYFIREKALNHRVISRPQYRGHCPVYDMEVADTNNFVANGVVVHNSGKSTAVRKLFAAATPRSIYALFGDRLPEAYELKLSRVKAPVFILGPYLTPTGGCDRIIPFDLIPELIEKYAARGHVVFEGVIVASVYGQVGTLMEKYKQNAVMLFLDTPLEDCIRRVQSRRGDREDYRDLDPKNLALKFHSIERVRQRVMKEGIMRAVQVSSEQASGVIIKLLRDA